MVPHHSLIPGLSRKIPPEYGCKGKCTGVAEEGGKEGTKE